MSISKPIRIEYTVEKNISNVNVKTQSYTHTKKQHSFGHYKIVDSKNRIVEGLFKYITGNEPKDGARWYMFIRGSITDSNGTIYEGSFIDNVLTKGTISFPDGNVYEGIFSNAKLISGTKQYSNGVVVSGTFDSKSKFANGVKIYPDGRRYDVRRDPRSFGKNLIIYEGTLTYPDKSVVECYFDSNFEIMNEDDVNDLLR